MRLEHLLSGECRKTFIMNDFLVEEKVILICSPLSSCTADTVFKIREKEAGRGKA